MDAQMVDILCRTWFNGTKTLDSGMKIMFTHRLKVSGSYNANLVFKSKAQLDYYLEHEIHALEYDYPGIRYDVFEMKPLKVGDECYVLNDDDNIYEIQGLACIEPFRYGYILSSGFIEDVAKCYPVYN
jgi:hypothetical protein